MSSFALQDLFRAYPGYEHLLASLQLAFAMLGMGALLAPRDFIGLAKGPRPLFLGLAIQLVAIPALAFGLANALPLPDGMIAGFVLLAAVPGGTMSNIVTHLGHGNIALSISLTSITSVGSLAVTPFLLGLLTAALMPPDFSMPTRQIATDIGLSLLAPLALGMALGPRLGVRRRQFSSTCIWISVTLIVVLTVGAAGAGRIDPLVYGWVAPFSLVLFALSAFALALAVTSAAGLVAADRLAIGVEVTLRNGNLAVLIASSLFPATGNPDPIGDGVMYVALLYGGVGALAAVSAALVGRSRVVRADGGSD